MRVNADDLVAELAKRGFTPILKQETVQGRDHYRVFAATGLDIDQARSIVAKLAQMGFSGFPVTEK